MRGTYEKGYPMLGSIFGPLLALVIGSSRIHVLHTVETIEPRPHVPTPQKEPSACLGFSINLTNILALSLRNSIIGYKHGLYWDNGKENGNYRDYRGYVI